MYLKINNEFNFGFQSIMHYIENVDDLKTNIDIISMLEPNKIHQGGVLFKAFNIQVQLTLSQDNFFDCAIIDVFGNMMFMLFRSGEEITEFLQSLQVQIETD